MPEGQMYDGNNSGISSPASNAQPMPGADKKSSGRVPNGEGSKGSSRMRPANSGTGPQEHSLPGEG